jgi:RHS repeat-associated protein
VNNITSIVNSLNNTNNQSFSYDALNRLITANGGYGNLGYGYDAVGNRLSETRNGSSDTYQYPATSNRLTGITRASGNRNFTYDAAGNPIQRTADDNSTQTYSFNKANRLSSVSVNGASAATYTYNPLGQRVIKTLANGTKEIYHYDESGQLIAVLDGTGTTLREYIYRGDQQIALINNGTIYYIHNDHLNTPQVITNQSQQVVWKGDYEPFGKLASNTTNSIEIFSRFPGQYLDGETGLYYNYFRDYDPSIGRYIESDPIGLKGGINTYAYVDGNPVNNIDPKGLLSIRFPWFPFPLPWLFPTPNNPSYPDYYDPIVPFDPTLPLPNTPHDDASDIGEVCPPNNPPEIEEDCFTVQQDCYDSLGGYYVLGKLSPPEQERLLRECVKAKAPHCL